MTLDSKKGEAKDIEAEESLQSIGRANDRGSADRYSKMANLAKLKATIHKVLGGLWETLPEMREDLGALLGSSLAQIKGEFAGNFVGGVSSNRGMVVHALCTPFPHSILRRPVMFGLTAFGERLRSASS